MSNVSKSESVIFSIGHSTHPIAEFIQLLHQHAINVVADVRSVPFSRFQPQYNREPLTGALKREGIGYVFLGTELGARSNDPSCYVDGRVQYRRLAQTALFRTGLNRLRSGSQTHRIAMLCTEKEPLECHRSILISRELEALGTWILHIHGDGHLEAHPDALARLLGELSIPELNLFNSRDELFEQAYSEQEERIAYVEREQSVQREEVVL